jgi:hypothetical protein
MIAMVNLLVATGIAGQHATRHAEAGQRGMDSANALPGIASIGRAADDRAE